MKKIALIAVVLLFVVIVAFITMKGNFKTQSNDNNNSNNEQTSAINNLNYSDSSSETERPTVDNEKTYSCSNPVLNQALKDGSLKPHIDYLSSTEFKALRDKCENSDFVTADYSELNNTEKNILMKMDLNYYEGDFFKKSKNGNCDILCCGYDEEYCNDFVITDSSKKEFYVMRFEYEEGYYLYQCGKFEDLNSEFSHFFDEEYLSNALNKVFVCCSNDEPMYSANLICIENDDNRVETLYDTTGNAIAVYYELPDDEIEMYFNSDFNEISQYQYEEIRDNFYNSVITCFSGLSSHIEF